MGESLNTSEARDLHVIARNPITTADNRQLPLTEEVNDDGKATPDLTGEQRKRRWAVMSMTVAGILAFKNDAVGFVAGMLCHWGFQVQDWWEERRSKREGGIRLVVENGEVSGR